ncbi:MAG: histidine--tRNA ligase [Burkholderiaceae bacterium]|nr:histidine--tRNA ligase [Burkholderiaceae bacterium]
MQKINAIRGMNDLLPKDAAAWSYLERTLADLTRAYGYEQIRTPIVEATALFQRGIGEVTDIVEKEMYSFEDRLNGEQLTLRPEGTAAVVRATIEHDQIVLNRGAHHCCQTNPLRILDSKNPSMQALIEGAPKLLEFLGSESLAHFEAVQRLLKANNIPFKINPRLVRGLDYYNLTVFEWTTEALGAQGTIAGGGRYDPLMERMGGKSAPACGWAMGMERVLDLMAISKSVPESDPVCDVYVLHQGGDTLVQAMIAAEALRSAGIDVILHCPPDGQSASFKSQMKKADASGAQLALIIGPDELARDEAQLKDLRGTGEQHAVPLSGLLAAVVDALVDS